MRESSLDMSSEGSRARFRRLTTLAPQMVQGSLSWTYRTCGKTGCRCQQGAKHGPDGFVTFRRPDGRPGAFYVPKGREREVEQALRAWRQFQTLARRLAEANRERLRRALRRRTADAASRRG